ncbi:MAG: hypothetical protein ABI397_02825 [Candidatus Saccharimonas sp.]
MPILTKSFLQDIGLELDDETFAALADHTDSTLHERVISEITDELSPEQAAELASLQNADDDILQLWLVDNVPDLQEIVADEIDILLGEIAENSDAIQG